MIRARTVDIGRLIGPHNRLGIALTTTSHTLILTVNWWFARTFNGLLVSATTATFAIHLVPVLKTLLLYHELIHVEQMQKHWRVSDEER